MKRTGIAGPSILKCNAGGGNMVYDEKEAEKRFAHFRKVVLKKMADTFSIPYEIMNKDFTKCASKSRAVEGMKQAKKIKNNFDRAFNNFLKNSEKFWQDKGGNDE